MYMSYTLCICYVRILHRGLFNKHNVLRDNHRQGFSSPKLLQIGKIILKRAKFFRLKAKNLCIPGILYQ